MDLSPDSEIVNKLKHKRDLLLLGDGRHKEIRPLLLVLGGGMRGVSGAGSGIAFILEGLGEVFDTVVGISTGAAIGAYFLGGIESARFGVSLYYNELARHFIRYTRRPIADIDYAHGLFQRTLDIDAIQSSRSNFFVGVTQVSNGLPVLINAKEAKPTIAMAIKGSVSIPGLSNSRVFVNGEQYIDGSFYPFPVGQVIEQFQPTDIVVFTNCAPSRSINTRRPVLESVLFRLLMRDTPDLRDLWSRRNQKWQEGYSTLVKLPRQGIRVGIVWKYGRVGLLTRNPVVLKQSAELAITETLRLLGGDHSHHMQLIDLWAG